MLNDAKIKHLPLPSNPAGKKYYYAFGLYIRVFPNGTKCWRYSYYFFGKGKELALGTYPLISLKQARQAHLEARQLLAQGKDPCFEKQRIKREKRAELFANSFGANFKEWYQLKLPTWKNEKSKWQINRNFELYVLPHIGNLSISSITPLQVFYLLQRISDKTETITRTKQRIKAVFDYAIMTGRATYNPASVIPQIVQKQVIHQPALPINLLPEFFLKLEAYPNRTLQLAIKLLILTWLRNTELRLGLWSEIQGNEWIIPAERMKMKRPHIVPLSDWALEILEELKSLSKNNLIICGNDKKTLSLSTLNTPMRRMGYKGIATPHGFRAMASTIRIFPILLAVFAVFHAVLTLFLTGLTAFGD